MGEGREGRAFWAAGTGFAYAMGMRRCTKESMYGLEETTEMYFGLWEALTLSS